MSTVYLVIPCYNEEKVLPKTIKELNLQLHKMIDAGLVDVSSRMLFVDDGSKDHTWQLIEQFHQQNPLVTGLKLAHNRGHQNALLAGLMTAKDEADCAISLDADLQDDVSVLPQFVQKFEEGCDVVYGVRNKRDTDTWFKRTSAEAFYRFLSRMGVDIVYNHADYRLMSRRALEALSEYKEVNLFLRGLVPLIGYRSDFVYYNRHERFAGESKYPLKKMLNFAIDGITSFSIKPLKIITNIGIGVTLVAVVGLLYALISHFAGSLLAGQTAALCSLWLLGGVQLICLGVVGTYVGKLYAEVKARPRFHIEKHLK
jgi:glycosyltransferase involved in cell wall biosynthesis